MSGIGPIDQSLLPAAVRNGTADERKTYAAALGFERQLVEQLAKQLASPTNRDESAPASAASSSYREQHPGVLSDAVIAGGGLGLAAQIAASIGPSAQKAPVRS
jgi:hypothetical protein